MRILGEYYIVLILIAIAIVMAGCATPQRGPIELTTVECAVHQPVQSQAAAILNSDPTYLAIPDALRSCTDALARCNAQ